MNSKSHFDISKITRKSKRPTNRKKTRGIGFYDDTSENQEITPIIYKKSMMEPVRQKLGQYVMSLQGNSKIDETEILRIKGKALNTFMGIVRTEMPRLSIEAFP